MSTSTEVSRRHAVAVDTGTGVELMPHIPSLGASAAPRNPARVHHGC